MLSPAKIFFSSLTLQLVKSEGISTAPLGFSVAGYDC
jgi:hypothetical protein